MSRQIRIGRCCCALVISVGVLGVGGCRMGVPIHVWHPPQLESTVGKRVVVSAVAGPDEVAGQLNSKLLSMAPSDSGRDTTFADAVSLQDKTEIRLVSGTGDETSDLALTAVARREGVDFLLHGEVLEDRHPRPIDPKDAKLKVSWRLTSLRGETAVNGSPVVVDVKSAIERYPDLGLMDDITQVLTTAAVRDTYRLMTPSVNRERAQLAIPYLMPGSKETRRGNAAALAGRWSEAEAIWQEALEQHPTQIAAMHNLALAAAAGQDFSRAKLLARKAIRRRPSALNKKTLAWIELKQRDYHQSFELPDPPEGWFVTQ